MIKIWQLFLSSILVSSLAVATTQTFDKLLLSSLKDSPFHPDIKFSKSVNETNRQEGNLNGVDKDIYPGTTEIKWTDYATSWTQFQQYYNTITLYVSGYADGKDAGRKNFTNLNIKISDLKNRSSWLDNKTLKASGSEWCLAYVTHSFTWGSYDQSGVYYDAFISESYIKLRFYLWTRALQVGTGSIWTESHLKYTGGVISSSWKINAIKDSLDTALSNEIKLTSNYSGSLEDKRNIIDPTGKGNDETTLINGVIAKILDDEYNEWKQYIQPFAFNNKTREAGIVFKFPDPITNQQQVWTFYTPINITLSHDYWSKSLKERLRIEPGKIVNPKDSTKGMIDDVPVQLEPDQVAENYGGNLQYHTSAHVEFDGMEDSSEWMTVNGQPVEVLNNKFIYNMIDNRVDSGQDAINVYDIIVYHDDGNYQEQYQIKYTISNLVPTLEEKWYAWDPEKNSDQQKLIEPTLPNGKPNPDYDKEINPETGTKTQIIWVKKKSQYPFPLDPLDKNGEKIDSNKNPDDYDLGFIAEGSVAGMGVQQLFNSNQIKTVVREGVDISLNQFSNPNDKQKLTEISSDSNNKYWSWQGMWHYITKTIDGLAYEKYVLIGAKYQENYPRFLDILENSSIAVDFWTTIHGVHLKNYLAEHKHLESKEISKLSYEQVASYWKEYTSDVIAQRIPPDPNPSTYFDLSSKTFFTIKMNEISVEEIKEEIKNQIKKQLANTDLIYDEDYELKPFDDQSLKKLLDYDSNGNATMNLNINALATSTRAIGSNQITIINNIHYDPDTVFDLSTIAPWSLTRNFSKLTIEQLRENWILQLILEKLTIAEANLVYQTDYGVRPLDDETLQQFLTSKERVSLTITIFALDESLKAINGTTLTLINDPDADVAPPDPGPNPDPDPDPDPNPDPDPDPNPNPDPDPNPLPPDEGNNWISRPENLIIMSVIAVLLVGSVTTVIFFKYRFKKGIGGKKLRKNKTKIIKK